MDRGVRAMGVFLLVAACSGSNDDLLGAGTVVDGGSGAGGATGGSAGTDAGAGSGGTAGTSPDAGAGAGGAAASSGAAGADASTDGPAGQAGGPVDGGCVYQDDVDHDGDGFSFADGDCNDCQPEVNPGAYDFVNGADDDCDGVADNEPADCDSGFAIDDPNALNGARAIGLCRFVDPVAPDPGAWGVINARYVMADGNVGMNPLSHGLLPEFGAAEVQAGQSFLSLSSGTARAPDQAGYQSPSGADMGTSGNPPAGYPKESPACPGVVTGGCHDPAALEIVLRAPTNARSFSFDFNFYTYEFPNYICSEFNDFFVAMMNPIPAGLTDGNVVFDANNNPVSVNSTALLQVCQSQTAGGKNFPCPLGTGLLASTGFEGDALDPHAATGWLRTRVPVVPGEEVTVRFGIWDSGDAILDSTVLVDRFEWHSDSVVGPVTEPVSP